MKPTKTPGSGQITKMNETAMFRMGPTEEVHLPSGFKVTIRERNGDDEDILSRVKDNKDGSALNNFLSAIITDPKMTGKQIAELKLKDKYYLLFRSRIQSLGSQMTFKHVFAGDEDKTKEVFFEEDLNQYDWDFSKPYSSFPFKPKLELGNGETDEYFKYRCTPYPDGSREEDGFEITLPSGVICRMKYLTGEGEQKSLKKSMNDLTINDKLRVRDFELKMDNGKWQRIERYNMLSAKDMMVIRTELDKRDEQFDMLVETVNPLTGQPEYISMFLKEEFFFPLTR